MKTILGLLIIIGGIAFGIWLAIWIMLYGGIMQAITNWNIDTSKVVWGIIRAVFFQVGIIPAYLIAAAGWLLMND